MFSQLFPLNSLWPAALGLLAALWLAPGAQAQPAAPGAPDYLDATQRWLDHAVANVRPAGVAPLRMEVAVGALSPRLQLGACAKVEPYIPVGMRLWGKTRLGLRCLDGPSKWNVFLPVTIKAYGTAWVIKGQVAAGAVLTQDDAIEAEVDWAEEASPIVANPAQWIGQVAARNLSSGQALRQALLKPAQVFQAGSQVRVLAQGVGFQVSSSGQALSAGVVGQSARVRMDNGRVMTGIVLDERTVRLEI